MPKVAISWDFLTAYSKIPKSEQKKAREFIGKFFNDPTSHAIDYEPIHQAKDPKARTVRIGIAWRAVVVHPEQGDVYLLAWVDHHDEARDWAKNKVFDINAVTGALQVVDVEQIENLAKIQEEEEEEKVDEPEPAEQPGPFDDISDEDLAAVGLPLLLLPSIRALKTEGQFDKLRPYLPAETYEALFYLVCGYSVEDALAQVTKPTKVDTENFEKTLEHPDTKRRFRIINTDAELLSVLDAPLERWRLFLHPTQEALVKRCFNGPARVLGGAGTGKTVVAMHRACHLARDVFTDPEDKILFTTYTRNLARNLSKLLESLCGPELERIVVANLHSWAVAFMRSHDISFDIANEQEKADCWVDAFALIDDQKWTPEFLRAEWDQVVQWHGVTTFKEYRRASRVGRGTRLSVSDKEQVWKILAEYRRVLKSKGKVEWPDVIRETRTYIEEHKVELPFRAVVVDEAQDLHPEDWKLITVLAPAGDDAKDNIFLVGDAHQRIYGRKLVLGRLGLNIKGRSRRLKINYRTTDEIRKWAIALLDGVDVDDLDGGKDSSQGYKSLLTGPEPEVHLFKTRKEEESFLIEHINNLTETITPEELCLVGRTWKQVNRYSKMLENAKIEHTVLDKDTESDDGEGVRVATMHRVKGLEFTHMIIVGIEEGAFPKQSYAHLTEDEAEAQERSLVYVSATRAKEGLTVTAAGKVSPYLLTTCISSEQTGG